MCQQTWQAALWRRCSAELARQSPPPLDLLAQFGRALEWDADLPQDPRRLGGTVLRVDVDGRAVPGNNGPAGFDARIYSYGLRNVQGIALRPAGQPGAGQADTTKYGPNHSDEVTALPATRWRSLV